jgi:hypothetical protein
MGAKEDESSTGLVWVAGFHHVTASSRLVRVLKLMNRLFLSFSNFWGAATNRGYGIVDTGHDCIYFCAWC